MNKVNTFGRLIVCLLICSFFLISAAAPASAAMVELEIVREDRKVSDVHYSASGSSTVIGTLSHGTPITITGEKNGFYMIHYAGMQGYIAKEQTVVDDNGFYYVNCDESSKETAAIEGLGEEEYTEMIHTLLSQAQQHLGTPYRYGGTSPGGFDCSGYVMYIFSNLDISLSRTASDQLSEGIMVGKEDLRPGDLVFFQGTTGGRKLASHVGIYVGGGQFIHSANSGVRFDTLESGYWANHYFCARRVLVTGSPIYAGTIDTSIKTNRSFGPLAGAFLLLSLLHV